MNYLTINKTTYKPNGEARFGAIGYTDGEYKIFAREHAGSIEIFCGMKDWKPFFMPIQSVSEDQIVFYVDESNYDLDGYKLLD